MLHMINENPHILVIDDNREILVTLEVILKRRQYQVTLKERCENINDLVQSVQPDIILLDKSLGWADGTTLCQRLKADPGLSKIPVIIFSAYYKKREECLESGADDFIEKPFDMKSLLSKLAQHLNRSQGTKIAEAG